MLGLPVYYHAGPLGPPLRASCAYPGLFVPMKYEGRTLVDGFLTALVPIEGALLLGAEIVIAVYLEAGGRRTPHLHRRSQPFLHHHPETRRPRMAHSRPTSLSNRT